MDQRTTGKNKGNEVSHGVREMKIQWEDAAIPTIVYLSILFQANWNVIPKYWVLLIVSYLIFNLYTYVTSTFSKYSSNYLRVYLPYVFLPVIWKAFKILFIQPSLSLYAVFLISVLYEYIFYEKPCFLLALFRLAVVNTINWGMHRWLINTWSLF